MRSPSAPSRNWNARHWRAARGRKLGFRSGNGTSRRDAPSRCGTRQDRGCTHGGELAMGCGAACFLSRRRKGSFCPLSRLAPNPLHGPFQRDANLVSQHENGQEWIIGKADLRSPRARMKPLLTKPDWLDTVDPSGELVVLDAPHNGSRERSLSLALHFNRGQYRDG